ncbi:MAG: hypothetical protein JHD35_21850 [Sphingopyxis sp.]|nr:hypothetical protein [Sphingopyxis sp.]
MALNDEILRSAGSRWDDWLEFNPQWYDSPVAPGFIQRGLEVLNKEFGASPLFVLKDPRNCRLSRLWFDVLDKADVEPLVVIPLRNPLEVSASIEARDGVHSDVATLLWLRHVLDAEHGSRGRRRVFLTYEELLDNWAALADRLQHTLGLSWPRFTALTGQDVDAFIDHDSRHHVRSKDSVLANPMISQWVRETDRILTEWATSGEDQDEHPLLDKIRQQLNDSGPAFARLTYAVTGERQKNRELRGTITAKDGELVQLQGQVAALKEAQALHAQRNVEQIAAHSEQLQQLEALRQDVEKGKAAAEAELAKLRSHVESGEAAEKALSAAVVDKEQLQKSFSAERDRLNQLLAQGDAAFAQATSEKAQLLSQIHMIQQELDHSKKTLDDRQHELATVNSTLLQREEEIFQTLAAVDVERGRVAEVEEQLRIAVERLEASEAKLRASEAWVFSLAKDRKAAEDQTAVAQARLATVEMALKSASEQLAYLQRQKARGTKENRQLLQHIEELKAQNDTLHDRWEKSDERWIVSQSELVTMSRILQQREAELAAKENSKERSDSAERGNEVRMLSNLLREKEADADHRAAQLEWLQKVSAVVTGYPRWWALAPRHWREKWQRGRLSRRGLFDAEAYVSRYPDVGSSDLDPLRHYIIHGMGENRTF